MKVFKSPNGRDDVGLALCDHAELKPYFVRNMPEVVSEEVRENPRRVAASGVAVTSLCDASELAPYFVRNAPVIVRPNPHERLRVSAARNAYKTVPQIKVLSESTWRHLQTKVLREGLGPGEVEYGWIHEDDPQGITERVVQHAHGQVFTDADMLELIQRQPDPNDMKALWKLIADKYSHYEVKFSKPAFDHIDTEARAITVIHEACHVAAYLRWPSEDVGHGAKWKKLMGECGCRPDVYGSVVLSLHISVRCGSCGDLSSLDLPDAASLLSDAGYLVCRECGNPMTGEHVTVPEERRRAVERQMSRTYGFRCECGQTGGLDEDTFKALTGKAGGRSVRVQCPDCHARIIAARVTVGGRFIAGGRSR